MPGISIQSLLNPADSAIFESQNNGQQNNPHRMPETTSSAPDTRPSSLMAVPVFAPSHGASWNSGLCLGTEARESAPLFPASSTPSETRYNVRLTHKTLLSTLYVFDDPSAWIEYPETKEGDPVGYLVRQESASEWRNPANSFVYSLDRPSGGTKNGETITCSLLVNADGEMVPCKQRHSTCQGSKICPAAHRTKWVENPHCRASFASVRDQLRSLHLETQAHGPEYDIFKKTAAFITALRKTGCGAPKVEDTVLSASEQQLEQSIRAHESDLSRGRTHSDKCGGRIFLEYDHEDEAFLRCEHYSCLKNRDHYIQFLHEGYHIEYLEAYFNEDTEEMDRIELEVKSQGFGPLSECSTIQNVSTQRKFCPIDHRDSEHVLLQLKLERLECKATVNVIQPVEESREACPWILVICKGAHPHPVPFPLKTPPPIRDRLMGLLKSLDDGLADLTPRRLLRHPVLRTQLQTWLRLKNPTLSDLHISLANREHVGYYIDLAKREIFPHGTGWEGLVHLKHIQDITTPEGERYIRRIVEIPSDELEAHDEDEGESASASEFKGLRMVVCMTQEGSRRMLAAPYLQSDIGFKRVVGFYEFEIGCLDRSRNTTVIFCRVFLNRQSAAAHQRVFEEIDDLILQDTGSYLRWRHIYAAHAEETEGLLLQWAGDQHGGQAKGLGLHLQAISQALQDETDLHEPHKLLASLSPYEHLHRIFRLCTVHAKRNIRKLAVSKATRNLMYSLICFKHQDWDFAIEGIKQSGEKAAIDWLQDKIRSQFAFEGLCWEKSHFPEMVWRAGERDTNLIESAHSNVNREGLHCTLVGGVKSGKTFDSMIMKTLKAGEHYGLRPGYQSGHISENAMKSLKRKASARHRELETADEKIEKHNKRIRLTSDNLMTAHLRGQNADRYQRVRAAFDKQVEAGRALVGTGSGKIEVVLP